MALEFKLTGDVLEVKEVIYGWNDTRVSYWYYNINAWMRSVTGKKGAAIVQSMTDEEIAWVRQHYLSKVRP